MNKNSKVLLGILGAAAAGVAIGLLVAPDKGKNTRKKIKSGYDDLAENVAGYLKKGKKAALNAADDIKQKAREAKADAEDKVNKLKESVS